MEEALSDYHEALLSTRCENVGGMHGHQMYTPSFTGPLADLNEEWAMRVLTEENMATYKNNKQLRFWDVTQATRPATCSHV